MAEQRFAPAPAGPPMRILASAIGNRAFSSHVVARRPLTASDEQEEIPAAITSAADAIAEPLDAIAEELDAGAAPGRWPALRAGIAVIPELEKDETDDAKLLEIRQEGLEVEPEIEQACGDDPLRFAAVQQFMLGLEILRMVTMPVDRQQQLIAGWLDRAIHDVTHLDDDPGEPLPAGCGRRGRDPAAARGPGAGRPAGTAGRPVAEPAAAPSPAADP